MRASRFAMTLIMGFETIMHLTAVCMCASCMLWCQSWSIESDRCDRDFDACMSATADNEQWTKKRRL